MPDPFGLKAGSTPPSGMANYMIDFHAVPKPHPAFQSYMGLWTPESGLSRVTAYSEIFEEEADCRSARRLYEQVKRQLLQVYGDGTDMEYVDEDGTWPEESEFWNALNHNERFHTFAWRREDGAVLDAGLDKIILMVCTTEQYDSSRITLSYEFEGYSSPERADEFGLDSL